MNNPLVSVIVVAYNASKSIIETLDSIKSQTYSPLELIVADDCSTDDTAVKCEKWLSENSNRFIKSKIIVNEKNMGNSTNLNVGIRASSGQWVKAIGDDLLVENAIEMNMTFATENNSNFISSQFKRFVDETGEILNVVPANDYQFPISIQHQFITHIKSKLSAPSPTWFFKRDLYDSVGGFNEKYKFSDDMPFLFKALKSGNTVSYMPKVTVLYRVTQNSLSNSRNKTGKQKQAYWQSRYDYFKDLIAPELKKNKLYGTLIRKRLLFFFYKKKIFSHDDSFKRYFYGAFYTIISKFENF